MPVLLLKGAALGRMVYGSPAERPISDFDLLIPADGSSRRGRRWPSASTKPQGFSG